MVGLEHRRRLVEEKALAVRRERRSLTAAREMFTIRVRSTLASPAVLLGLFAAGFAFGMIRRSGGGNDGDGARGGRLAAATAALLAGARFLERVQRVSVLLSRPDGSRPSGSGGAVSSAYSSSAPPSAAGQG